MSSSHDTWFPTIFPDRCDGCAGVDVPHCVRFCPKGVFEMRGSRVDVTHPLLCVYGCNACELVCPKGAITFPSRSKGERVENWSTSLRKVSCRICGKSFWTNFETDICSECSKRAD